MQRPVSLFGQFCQAPTIAKEKKKR